MSTQAIRLKVTTLSNLFIGGPPTTFEIGGVDMYTVTDFEGKPYIPGSSLKGSLRNIVRDLVRHHKDGQVLKIGQAYREYLDAQLQEHMKRIEQLNGDAEKISRMVERYNNQMEHATAECLFGMEGFNHTPKLIFNDLKVIATDVQRDSWEHLFSIDAKNKIHPDPQGPMANPRFYKTVRPGVAFTGEILLHRMELLPVGTDVIRSFIERALQQFNEGIYRLGNSGSRGYGRVEVAVIQEESDPN